MRPTSRAPPILSAVRARGTGGAAADGLRAGVVGVGSLGAVNTTHEEGVRHDIRGEPERGTAECVETVQMLRTEVHVGGGKVVAELFFGAGRDQWNDRATLLPHPGNGHLRG